MSTDTTPAPVRGSDSSEGLDVVLCKCGNPAPPAHSCPFAEEIHGVTDCDYCNCCDECAYQCAQDI